MQYAYVGRRACRGTYYTAPVLAYVDGVAEKVGCSFSHAVNELLQRTIRNGTNDIEEKLSLEVRRSLLLEEEKSLRERLKVILRSGAYLKGYAEQLLIGDRKQISLLKRRTGVYSHVNALELNIILRLLQRRKDLVNELLKIEDKLLPTETYPFALAEEGWTTKGSHITHGEGRRPNPDSKMATEAKQECGGEKENGK
jgi:hypothetical protein